MEANYELDQAYLALGRANVDGIRSYLGTYTGSRNAILAHAASRYGVPADGISLVPLCDMIVYDADRPDRTGHLSGKLLGRRTREEDNP